MKIKAALIVDNGCLSKWQCLALKEASEYLDVSLILSCQNTKKRLRFFKHAAYYALNIFMLKSDITKKVPLNIENVKTEKFESIYSGIWQKIPEDVSDLIKENGIKLVIKFGMSLLRIDEGLTDLDILSFHHGDPEFYRGRPAGFYELYNKENYLGIIVQKLNNQLDGGDILFRAYAKIYHYSYRKTAYNFYSNSRYLLKKSLINYRQGEGVDISSLGHNYKLPSNFMVVKFLMKLLYRNIHRIIYGLFFEKRWNVVKFGFKKIDDLFDIPVSVGYVPEIKSGYTFYADPFFSADGIKVRVEALSAKKGVGEIIELNSQSLAIESVLLEGSHFSYPYSFIDSAIEYLVPEVASHSSPYLLPVASPSGTKIPLLGLEGVRLLDGSLLKHNDVYYLFAGHRDSVSDCLFLYSSRKLEGPYISHPQNPVVMDPAAARMGGRLYCDKGKIYRFGQNNCVGYGAKLAVREIVVLSDEFYAESHVREISFPDFHGPHNIDINEDTAVLDFYSNQFSLLAGYRRLVAAVFR